MPLSRRLGGALAASGAVAILALTLVPNPRQGGASALTPLLCLVCGENGGADVVLNLLLFAPVGMGLRAAGWSWRRSVGAAGLLSLSVEGLQYLFVAGRDASLSDLVTNTGGAALAAAVTPYLGSLVAPDPACARRFYLAALALWLGTLSASAWVLMPWIPAGALRNDCTESYRLAEAFLGTVESVRLNGMPLPCDSELPEAAAIRGALSRGEVRLDVVASVAKSGGRALLHTVRTPRGPALAVVKEGRTAALIVPAAAHKLYLYPPALRLPLAFPAKPGTRVELHATVHDHRLRLASFRMGERVEAELALSPAHGWTAIFPWGIVSRGWLRTATTAWLAGLAFPIAYYAGLQRSRTAAWLGFVAALAVGLVLVPYLGGYPPAHWSEWLGGVLGGVLGGLLGRAVPRSAAYLGTR